MISSSTGISSTSSAAASSTKLTLRVDQPVADSYVDAHAYYNNNVDVSLKFQWYKSVYPQGCNSCGVNRGTIECRLCPPSRALYCSTSCLAKSWMRHQHHNNATIRQKATRIKDTISLDNTPPSVQMEKLLDSDTKSLFISVKDVGHVFQCECVAISLVTLEPLSDKIVVETPVVLPRPQPSPPRRMISAPYATAPLLESKVLYGSEEYRLKVVSYNVLAEIYATKSMYPYCPMWALSWSYRQRLLLVELDRLDADIVCLQEVQADTVSSFWTSEMKKRGYEGVYKQKTRKAMGLAGKVDGCAVFYKAAVLQLTEETNFELNAATLEFTNQLTEWFHHTNRYSSDTKVMTQHLRKHEMKTKRLSSRLLRDNVAQILLFYHIPTDRNIVVANTHMFSNPEFPDVKLWQAEAILARLEDYLDSKEERDLPLIFCGDFNSEPSSAVYKLLSTGNVNASRETLPEFNLATGIFRAPSISHRLRLASSYASVLSKEPAYTNYTGNWKGVIDYVWYSKSTLLPISVAEMHKSEVLEAESKSALPNGQFPSDHVALCVEFCLRSKR